MGPLEWVQQLISYLAGVLVSSLADLLKVEYHALGISLGGVHTPSAKGVFRPASTRFARDLWHLWNPISPMYPRGHGIHFREAKGACVRGTFSAELVLSDAVSVGNRHNETAIASPCIEDPAFMIEMGCATGRRGCRAPSGLAVTSIMQHRHPGDSAAENGERS